MLTREGLVELYRDLRDDKVLSVYVDGGQDDPADRRAWSVALDGRLADERRRIEVEAPDELAAFDAARALIEEALSDRKAFLQNRGWAGFATSARLPHAAGLPVPMPDLVRWERGMRVAPYVRALKQERPVVAAVADSRKVRIFVYHDGEVEERVDLIADRDFGDLADSVSSKRASRFSGARGEAGTDVARRLGDRAAERLQAEILDELEELAGHDGFVVFGGTTEVVTSLARRASRFGDRWLPRPSMHLGMTESEVRVEVEDAASELTRRLQDGLLREVVDAARSGGRGALGVQAVTEALREGRVDRLLISRGFREREADFADRFAGSAFEHGGEVEELSGEAAEHLDAEGEGVAARLRYTT
jgi:hypothetical protein